MHRTGRTLAQSLLEDGQVGGDTNDVLVLDELLQVSGFDTGAGQIVQPDRDTGSEGALVASVIVFSLDTFLDQTFFIVR